DRCREIGQNGTASNLQLSVNNIGATDARVMTFTPTTFTGWDAGGLVPTLNYSNLRGVLTVDAGGGDKYNLAGSPTGISSTVFNNSTDVRSSLYATAWQSTLFINDDWRAYLGQRILSDNSVERVKLLSGLSNLNVRFHFDSDSAVPTEFIIDGDLHAPGAHYTIDGQQPPGYEVPVLHALNSTIGLDVVIDGYRDPDDLYIYLPGGTVDANLTTTSDGSIQIDGKARLTGFNSSAPNIITANILSGGVTMTPLGTYDSGLRHHNN